MKIWFQNRRSKVKKLVRHPGPGCDDVLVTAADDQLKTDQLSTGSADAEDDEDDDGISDNKLTDEYHVTATSSSPSPSSQPQQQQQLSHRASSWHDIPSSFRRFPALTQLHYNYPLRDVRLSASDSSTTPSWSDSYSSSANRLQAPPCSGDSAVDSGHVTASGCHVTGAPRQLGYESLFHCAAHHWYSTQTSPQTLLT